MESKIAIIGGTYRMVTDYCLYQGITPLDFELKYKWITSIRDVEGFKFHDVIKLHGWTHLDKQVIDRLEKEIGKEIF